MKYKVGDIIQLKKAVAESFNIDEYQIVKIILSGSLYDFEILVPELDGTLPLKYSEIQAVFTKETNPEYYL